jgi:hypothetical protein
VACPTLCIACLGRYWGAPFSLLFFSLQSEKKRTEIRFASVSLVRLEVFASMFCNFSLSSFTFRFHCFRFLKCFDCMRTKRKTILYFSLSFALSENERRTLDGILVINWRPKGKKEDVFVAHIIKSSLLCANTKIQCCGSGSGIRCLFDHWIRDPGWVKKQDPDTGSESRMNNPDHIPESLNNNFLC